MQSLPTTWYKVEFKALQVIVLESNVIITRAFFWRWKYKSCPFANMKPKKLKCTVHSYYEYFLNLEFHTTNFKILSCKLRSLSQMFRAAIKNGLISYRLTWLKCFINTTTCCMRKEHRRPWLVQHFFHSQ